MALDWSPITLQGFTAAEQAREAGETIGSLGISPLVGMAIGKPTLEAKDASEYITALGRNYYKQEGLKDTQTWDEFVKSDDLLDYIHNTDNSNLKVDRATGVVTYWDEDAKEFKEWKDMGGTYRNIMGGANNQTPMGREPVLISPNFNLVKFEKDPQGNKTGKILSDKRTPFQKYIDDEWRSDISSKKTLDYRAPKSALGALMDKDWTYRSGKQEEYGIPDLLKKTGITKLPPQLRRGGNLQGLLPEPQKVTSALTGILDKMSAAGKKLDPHIENLLPKLSGKLPNWMQKGGNIQQSPIGQYLYQQAGIGQPQMGRDFIELASGQTLGQIANQYNMSLDDLIALNPQISDPNVVQVGTQIILNPRTAKRLQRRGRII